MPTKSRNPFVTEGKPKSPDYSVDKILSGADHLKDALKKSLHDFEDQNKDLDKKKAAEEKKSDQLKKELEREDKTAQATKPKKPNWKEFKDKKSSGSTSDHSPKTNSGS